MTSGLPNYRVGMGYDELKVGDEFRTAGVTVTESHIAMFAALSGDWNPLHVNEEFARGTVFKSRIAHGLLTVSLISGPLGMAFSGTALALTEASLRFESPVRAGDTVFCTVKVTDKKDRPEYGGGVVTLEGKTVDQKGRLVLESTFKLIVTRKG